MLNPIFQFSVKRDDDARTSITTGYFIQRASASGLIEIIGVQRNEDLRETEWLVEDAFLDAALQQSFIAGPALLANGGFGEGRVQGFGERAVTLGVCPPFFYFRSRTTGTNRPVRSVQRVDEIGRKALGDGDGARWRDVVAFEPKAQKVFEIVDKGQIRGAV